MMRFKGLQIILLNFLGYISVERKLLSCKFKSHTKLVDLNATEAG